MRVADYIAFFLIKNDIRHVFTVPGGGAMHLNDAFGHNRDLQCIYNHHEQAAAMAAEAYARVSNKIATVCVTTGPGASNAITGVLGGWMGSIPMLILSGQARYATTVYASGLTLRSRGTQEFDVIGTVKNITKYCELVVEAKKIRYYLEKAIYYAYHGRPGPCWLDIPLDVQAAQIDPNELEGFVEPEQEDGIPDNILSDISNAIQRSKRPILFAGNGIRLAKAHALFLELVDKLNFPVVTGMGSIDAIYSEHSLFVGRSGTTGTRAGNFAVQNCDLFLSLGSRLSFFTTGFDAENWAQKAYKIVNDIDAAELEKDSIAADIKVCCDVKVLIKALLKQIEQGKIYSGIIKEREDWLKKCQYWKKRYPVVLSRHYEDKKPNIYAFFKELSSRLSEKHILVVSVGTSRVVGSQASDIAQGVRFITNSSTAAMGYCLPAAIGCAQAEPGKKIVLVTGEGSLQMNLQELQTIKQNKIPVSIFIMNNQGYHSIRMTQNAFFPGKLVGVGPESGDISFPDMERIAYAYDFPFRRCSESNDVQKTIEWALDEKICICEMMLSKDQVTEPKVLSRRLENGQMISGRLEDMAPFLPREELMENMLNVPQGEFKQCKI